MNHSSKTVLIKGLRATIAHIEAAADLEVDNPHLAELKRIILRRIADLEMLESETEQAGDIPVTMTAGD